MSLPSASEQSHTIASRETDKGARIRSLVFLLCLLATGSQFGCSHKDDRNPQRDLCQTPEKQFFLKYPDGECMGQEYECFCDSKTGKIGMKKRSSLDAGIQDASSSDAH